MDRRISLYISLIFIFLLYVAFYYSKEIILFRDHSIIFDGSLRLLRGYKIYEDFGVPVGPVTFLFFAFLFKLFGVSWYVFQGAQLVQNAIMFTVIIRIYEQAKFSNKEVLLYSAGSLILFLNFYTLPWYNHTAVFFGFLAILFFLQKRSLSLFISGIFLGLSLLSKQDIGLIFTGIVLSGVIFETYIDVDLKALFLRKFTFLILGVLLGIVSIAYYEQGMIYWLNPGNYDYSSKLTSLLTDTINFQTLFGFVIAIISISRRELTLFLASTILIGSGITKLTSGMPLSHFYFVPFIPFIYKFISQIRGNLYKYLLLACIFVVILNPLARAIFSFENLIYDYPEVSAINHRKIVNHKPIINLGECIPILSNSYSPKGICRMAELMDELGMGFKRKIKVINISEFAALYEDYKFMPIKGFPLWFHENISIPEALESKIIDSINQEEPDLIILQPIMGAGFLPFISNLKSILDSDSSRYTVHEILEEMPASITFTEKDKAMLDAYIYKKKDIIKHKP